MHARSGATASILALFYGGVLTKPSRSSDDDADLHSSSESTDSWDDPHMDEGWTRARARRIDLQQRCKRAGTWRRPAS